MDEEGKKKAVKSLLAEFASSFDRSEATTCVRELGDGECSKICCLVGR